MMFIIIKRGSFLAWPGLVVSHSENLLVYYPLSGGQYWKQNNHYYLFCYSYVFVKIGVQMDL